MKYKKLHIFTIYSLLIFYLCYLPACNTENGESVETPKANIYQEASWEKSYRSINDLCYDNTIIIIAVGEIKKIVEVLEINEITYYTRFAFKIRESFKGQESGEIIINQMGTPNKAGYEFRDDPLFKVGEEYLLFLKTNNNEIYYTPGPWGRYQIKSGKVYSLDNTLTDEKIYQAPEALEFNGNSLSSITDEITSIISEIPLKRVSED